MQDYQQAFLEFSIAEGALKFGHFKLKSGRESPYFFNAGHFNRGASLAQVGRYYAAAIIDSGIACDLIYGPAYKGIPLAAATAIALADHHGRDLPYAFNRKEAKDHGEGGLIVGSPLVGDVLIIDDVITAGTSVRESLAIIEAAGARPAGVMIALDRQELGQGQRSAVDEVRLDLGLPVASIVTMNDMITFLEQRGDNADILASMHAYRERWGAG